MEQYILDLEDDYITMIPDKLDDGSCVINFDVLNDNEDLPMATGGYVMTRQDNEDQCFYVSVFNADGDVLSETVVPFNFKI